jgi:hypothetical protein
MKDAIEARLNTSLLWDRLENRRACRISYNHPASVSITDSEAELEEVKAWAIDAMKQFRTTFKKYTSNLSSSMADSVEGEDLK